jgi:uncharacterized protein YkwD
MTRGGGWSLWRTVLVGIGLMPFVFVATFFGLVLAAEATGMGSLSHLEAAAQDFLIQAGLVSTPTAPPTVALEFGPYLAVPPTETPEPTATEVPPSPTAIPSDTASPSATPTSPETPTSTQTETGTPSPTPSSSPTTGLYATATAWRSRTPTRTPVRTPTRTATPTASSTASGGPGVPPTTAAPTEMSEVLPTLTVPTSTSEGPVPTSETPSTAEVPPTIALPTFTSTTPPTIAVPTNTPVGSTCDAAANPSVEGQVITLVNDKRTSQGLPAYTVDSRLTAAARTHATDMACNHFASHTGSDGSSVRDRVARQGYSWSWIGENYYVGSGSAQTAFNWWMNSAPHTANILSPNYTQFGVGYVYDADSDYRGYFVIVFAKPG